MNDRDPVRVPEPYIGSGENYVGSIDDKINVALSKQRSITDNVLRSDGYVYAWVYKHLEEQWYNLAYHRHNLLTTDGRDFFHAQVYTNTSAGTRGANYLAVSTSSGGTGAGHTALASE